MEQYGSVLKAARKNRETVYQYRARERAISLYSYPIYSGAKRP